MSNISEDACYCACRAAAEQKDDVFVFQVEPLADVGAYGAARGGDRSLKSYGTTERHGDGGSNDGTVHVVSRHFSASARDGVEYVRNAVANLVADYVFEKQNGKYYADGGKNKQKDVSPSEHIDTDVHKQHVSLADKGFQYHCGQSGTRTDQDAEYQNEITFRDVSQTPDVHLFADIGSVHFLSVVL